ncbi:regulatory protein RecX [Patulibacter americanus]|uniref:regulatory protein RecX n=1 Tax=Patulibacter americanus TaxID=588672 RepID=UPI0003B45AAC|nr:regulatory protein RecX [Patulibacter americanus]
MSGDGEERAARRPVGDAPHASGTPDDEPPLADLTAGGPSPLEDLGAPWEGPAPGSPLADLTGDARSGATDEHAAPAVGDDWSPAAPLPADDASAADGAATPDETGADWAPLPDLGRRPRSGRSRRRSRSGDAASPRGQRRVRDAELSAAQAPGDDAHDDTTTGAPGAGDVTRPAAPGASVSDGHDAAPDDAAPVRGDGLPPGALGAGAAGTGLGLFGGGEAGDIIPSPPADVRPGRRKGRRRGKRGGGDPDADGAAEGAEEAPERPLTAEERLQHALTLAYRHLSKRDRTVSEVRAHLEKREIDETSIVGALKELTDFGYVDDERYATRFVEDKRRLEGWGHLRIEQGLRKTGIPREVADRALAEDPLRNDEDELAVEALEQRLAGRPLEDDRARQKALRLLATKGYALETAYAAVRTYERRCVERADD